MAYQPYNSVKQNLRGYRSPSGFARQNKAAGAAVSEDSNPRCDSKIRFAHRSSPCLFITAGPGRLRREGGRSEFVAIADTLDAIIYDRAYRPAQDLKAARTEIKS